MSPPASLPALPPLPPTVKAGRIPQWLLDRLVHRPCPACGADAPADLCRRPDRLTVAHCTACGMCYLPDIPGEADLQAFYRDYGSYKGLKPGPEPFWHRWIPWRPPDPFVEILLRTGGLAGQRVCEVGCTYGYFLRKCRRWQAEVTGVDWDDEAIAYLRELGIAGYRELPAGSVFDVICAFQLLEHLADPGTFLAGVARCLAPDGRLLVALPNGGAAERTGPGWVGFRVDLEHLNYFSARSLAGLLERHGLYTEQVWEYMQADLPRNTTPPPRRTPIATLLSAAWARIGFGPYPLDGTYILCALARKATPA